MNATSIPRNLYSIAWQTMALGPIQGWNTVRCAIFHEGRRPRASQSYRRCFAKLGGMQGRKLAQMPKAIGKRACGAPSAICKIPILFCWDLNEIAPSQDQDRRTGQVECISPGPAGLARILVVFPRRRDCTGL
jgi:hypothetical protein